MWLKWPGIFNLHFSQSARYPMLNDFFIPGCKIHELSVCLLREWPNLQRGDGVAGAEEGERESWVSGTEDMTSVSIIPVSISTGAWMICRLGWIFPLDRAGGFTEPGR